VSPGRWSTHPRPQARDEPTEDGGDAFSLPDAFAHAPALVAMTRGPDHVLTYTNGAHAEIFGQRPLGVPLRKAFPELVDQGIVTVMDRVYRSGAAYSVRAAQVDYRVNGSGSWRRGYFTCSYSPIHQADGQVGGVLLFAVDVTDQVQANQRLRESERRHRQTALTLQRSLLPQSLYTPDDLRVATRYLPGGADAEVGGDWYDVIPLGAGRTAVVIGDVMGRGVRAAAVMGQLRTAVRAYARLDLPPHEVLQLLEGLATDIDPGQIATCVYAVFDPADSTFSYSVAGHLPPLARFPDGSVHLLDQASGPPLGTEGWLYRSKTMPLETGTAVVLYTDGLVERRNRDIDAGVDRLVKALERASGSSEAICDHLLRRMKLPQAHDDDVAVLVTQVPEWSGQQLEVFRSTSLDLLGGGEVAARARAFTSGVVSSWHLPEDLRDKVVLSVSELVANALTHGKPPIGLRLRRTDRRLIVEVRDADEHMPRRQHARATDEAGRGITIVATIATSWGARPLDDGKAVWCEFLIKP
jgi:serine phosphatase RsbU (regulator of sigma subunit)/anti-sigma regulatory factor (Ser/Thr protein kinase)